jgi:hypothetical protein
MIARPDPLFPTAQINLKYLTASIRSFNLLRPPLGIASDQTPAQKLLPEVYKQTFS